MIFSALLGFLGEHTYLLQDLLLFLLRAGTSCLASSSHIVSSTIIIDLLPVFPIRKKHIQETRRSSF